MRSKRWGVVIWIGASLLLHGCARMVHTLPDQTKGVAAARLMCPEPTTATHDEVSSLFHYIDRVRIWPKGIQIREYQRAEEEFKRWGSSSERLRLAMLLMLPNDSFHDDERAYDLLDDYRKEESSGTDSALTALTSFLLVRLIEQGYERNSYRELEKRWINEKQALQREGAKLNETEKKWMAERKERASLERQLEALKEIEANITQRQPPEALLLDEALPRKDVE